MEKEDDLIIAQKIRDEERLEECPICGSSTHTDGRCEWRSQEDYYHGR